MTQSAYTLNLWQRIAYGLTFAFAYTISLLPFRVLFVISDLIYLLAYHVVGYRKDIVRKNLRDSFPEKNEKEIIEIEREFYRWFGDYIVETLKLLSISDASVRKHCVFHNTKMTEEVLGSGQSIALYIGHYCNWEFITSIPLWVHTYYQGSQVYHVLESHVMDKLVCHIRQRKGTVNVTIMDTLRYILSNKKQGRPVMIGLLGDQVPFWNNIGHWMTFMNHPNTPVLTGSERLARRYNMACVYVDMKRIRRGYYEIEFQLMTDKPNEQPEMGITEEYFRRLEKSIHRQPALWLWSHNRWKRTREEYDTMIDPVTGKLKM